MLGIAFLDIRHSCQAEEASRSSATVSYVDLIRDEIESSRRLDHSRKGQRDPRVSGEGSRWSSNRSIPWLSLRETFGHFILITGCYVRSGIDRNLH